MSINTLAELKAYAYEHFPDDFSKLPAVKIVPIYLYCSEATLRFGDIVVVTINKKLLGYDTNGLQKLEPFSWVSDGTHDSYHMRETLLRYYCSTEYEVATLYQSHRFKEHFREACARVAKVIRAAEAIADDSSRWNCTIEARTHIQNLQGRIKGNEDRLQQHETRIQELLANNNTLKQRVDTSKDKFATFETRMVKLEAEVKAKKDGTCKDNMDRVRECAVGKVEVSELRLKLATSEAQVAMLAKENAELRKKLAG